MNSYTNIFGAFPINPVNTSYLELALTNANVELVWPLETTTGQPEVSAQIDVTTATIGLAVVMPDAEQGSTGPICIIYNAGANTFGVEDNTGNQIASIAPGLAWWFTLTDNSTQAGTWRVLQLGAGTSQAQASTLAGRGLTAAGPLLNVSLPAIEVSSNLFVTTTYGAIALAWTGNVGTMQFDRIANLGTDWFCEFTNIGTGAVTLIGSNGETINGQGSLLVEPGNSGFLIASPAVGGFITIGALLGVLPIVDGGTGANNATGALDNFGGTNVGISIFTAPNVQAVLTILGLLQTAFVEQTITTGQSPAPSQGGTIFVGTTNNLTLTLPLTESVTTQYVIGAFAVGITVTVTPQPTDSINGQAAGVSFNLSPGSSALFITDANGKWWPVFAGGSSSTFAPAAAAIINLTPATNAVVFIDTSAAPTRVNLPAFGGPYTIKDTNGHAGTNAITVYPPAGTIDGAATFLISQNYGSNVFAQNGSNWNVIG